MKLLTFAHRGEAQAFLSAYLFRPVEFFFDGLLKNDDYYLLITGEGPHSASEKTISVLAKFSHEITHVYNLGVAGSLNDKLKLNDLVWIKTSYAHHAEKLEFKSFTSTHATELNDCITSYSRILEIEEKKKLALFANLVDRELWAVASSATLFKKGFSSLKIISDELIIDKEIDVCKFVKEKALHFSEKLFSEFTLKEDSTFIPLKPEKPDSEFLNNPLFYFTTSQERKLNSTLEGLKLKGIASDTFSNNSEIQVIKESEKLPKERTRLLLQLLAEQLNPVSVKIRAEIESALSPLSDAKIITTYDTDYEESWLNLTIRIQSARDLEKVKNALKIFSYEDYKKILDGNFNV